MIITVKTMNNQMCSEAGTSKTINNVTITGNNTLLSDLDLSEFCDESVLNLLDEPFDVNAKNASTLRKDSHYVGFDASVGDTWIYPTNYPMRQYQFSITKAALFKNTLVVLPTGLGKTFIAAVVMYNIFRWYPTGKIIFMAPTRPLVAQQIEACYQIMGIPKNDTAELTGKQNKKNRLIAWQTKRVFFATPQVVWSDINDPEINFPINDVKLIVVDEAHKAKGKYAYTDVVKAISSRNKMFRILALSATPGRLIKDVVQVVENLLISHIEVRGENAIDVSPYTFKKNIKAVVVELGNDLRQIRNDFVALLEPYVCSLQEFNATTGHTGNLTRGWLIMERQRFNANAAVQRHPQHSKIITDFSVCISMFHALELLERHGIRVFLNYFDDASNADGASEKYFVMADKGIKDFLHKLREFAGPNPFAAGDTTLQNNTSLCEDLADLDYGHPKFKILRKSLTDHFRSTPESRSIIFCEFRESVFLLNQILAQSRPLIKARAFVGQGSSKNGTVVTQKEQIAIMNDFRSGICNTLIATCVAEEGIDVGEVDLIICFDVTNKNPTRFVQRIGRTGRKRQGKVIMLVSEGREQKMFKDILANKDETNQKIGKSPEVNGVLYRHSPRIVPPEFNPQYVETFIKISNETAETVVSNTKGKKKSTKKATKKSPKKKSKAAPKVPKAKTKMRNMREFFQPIDMDDNELDVFETSNTSNTSKIDQDTELNLLNESHRNNLPTNFDPYSNLNENMNVRGKATTVSKLPFEEKLTKLLERYRAIKEARQNVPSEPVQRLKRIICHDKVPNLLKLNCLKNDYKFVQKYYESQNPLDSELKKIIEKVFGGKRKVQQFINRKEEKWADLPPSRQETIFQILVKVKRIETNLKAEHFETQQKQLTPFPNMEISGSQVNYYIDPELDLPVFFDMESKYESQRMQCNETEKHFAGTLSSTPIKAVAQKVLNLNSPTDSPIKNSPIAKAFQRSILKSRQYEESQMNSSVIDTKSPHKDEEPQLIHTDYLKYLGLNTIDDLFADDDDNIDDIHPKISMLQDLDDVENTNVTRTEKDEISDIFADDDPDDDAIDYQEVDEIPSTQLHDRKAAYTVAPPEPTQYTQLFNICDEEEAKHNFSYTSNKENVNHNNNSIINDDSNAEAGQTKKNLYIGSINDLFASDSETELQPIEPEHTVPQPKERQPKEPQPQETAMPKFDETIPKSDSDCTEEYDFDEIIFSSQVIEDKTGPKINGKSANVEAAITKRISSLENSTGNVLRSAETVYRSISDDIFAMNDSHKSNNKSSSSAVDKLQHKESDIAIIAQRSGTPPTISKPNSTKSTSLIAQSSASFILKAEANPCVKTSSPASSDSLKTQARAQSPSLFRINSSGLSGDSRHEHQSKLSLNASNKPITPIQSKSPPRNSLHENESFRQIRSPSTLIRRPNLSRLRLNATKEPPKTPDKAENSDRGSSPFLTCKPLSGSSWRSPNQISSDADFELSSRNIKSKLNAFHYKPIAINQSTMSKINSIIVNQNDVDSNSTTPDEDELFATCKSNNSDRNQSNGQKRKMQKKSKTKAKRKKYQFIDDEAGVSGDESEDEDEEDYFFTQAIQDGTILDEGDPNVDMQAKYLQSIRSPMKTSRFKIPASGYRNFVPMSQIYSQQVVDEDVSEFLDDSFVVKSDEVAEEESEADMCELELAEQILKEQRRRKRKLNTDEEAHGKNSKRRRRIVTMMDSSDTD